MPLAFWGVVIAAAGGAVFGLLAGLCICAAIFYPLLIKDASF